MAVSPAPVRVSSQRPLALIVASVTLVANDKGDNEMILGAVNRSHGICLIAKENPRKPQLGDRLCDQSSPQMGVQQVVQLDRERTDASTSFKKIRPPTYCPRYLNSICGITEHITHVSLLDMMEQSVNKCSSKNRSPSTSRSQLPIKVIAFPAI